MSLDKVIDYFNINTSKDTDKPSKAKIGTVEAKENIYYEQQKQIIENIKQSEKLRSEITKDIESKEDYKKILIKCINCIGLMTNDKVFTKQNIENI